MKCITTAEAVREREKYEINCTSYKAKRNFSSVPRTRNLCRSKECSVLGVKCQHGDSFPAVFSFMIVSYVINYYLHVKSNYTTQTNYCSKTSLKYYGENSYKFHGYITLLQPMNSCYYDSDFLTLMVFRQ